MFAMFDLKLLECFEALVSERSVSRAATRLNLTQSAMSHALTRLRRLFDDPLLLKGQAGMTPTARADELREPVNRLLADAKQLIQKPASFDPATARLRFVVMAAEYAEYLLTPPLVQQLRREAPGIDVEFRAADRERALGYFERAEMDFRLGWWPEPPQTLRFKLLFRDRLVCIARKKHPTINGKLAVDDYTRTAHVRLQTPRTGVSTHAIDRAVSAFHKKLRVTLRVQNALALCNAVATSELLATVPERLAHSLAKKFPIQVLPLPLNVPDIRMALYWHERTHNQPAHRWFRQTVVDIARSL